jgi:hypothetical protein
MSAVLSLFVGFAFAIIEKQSVRYEHPVRAIRGRSLRLGKSMRVV